MGFAPSAADIIARLALKPHREGGHYRETFRDYRCDASGRALSTAIYFLLARGERSHWHRIDAVEIWHYCAGSPLSCKLPVTAASVASGSVPTSPRATCRRRSCPHRRGRPNAAATGRWWAAPSHPTMRFVQIKSVESQAILMLHRTRMLLVRQRTMAANALRAGCAEFGLVAAQGLKGLHSLMAQVMDQAAGAIPELARSALRLLARQWEALDDDIRGLEARIVRAAREDHTAQRLIEIPSVGPITASTTVAMVPDARMFRTGRDFAAWLGLTPRQQGTGGKTRSGGISKQGDRTLRTLLIVGASSVLRQAKLRGSKDPWVSAMLARRPFKVVAVALAARTARIIWALMVKGERYRDRAVVAAAA